MASRNSMPSNASSALNTSLESRTRELVLLNGVRNVSIQIGEGLA